MNRRAVAGHHTNWAALQRMDRPGPPPFHLKLDHARTPSLSSPLLDLTEALPRSRRAPSCRRTPTAHHLLPFPALRRLPSFHSTSPRIHPYQAEAGHLIQLEAAGAEPALTAAHPPWLGTPRSFSARGFATHPPRPPRWRRIRRPFVCVAASQWRTRCST